MSNGYNKDGSHSESPKEETPYGFVPVVKERLDYVDKKPLNKYSEDLLSGYINCKLYVLNKLIVGNSQIAETEQASRIYPLEVGGRIIISANTLKSCVRNFLAAMLQYPLTRIDKNKYGFSKQNKIKGFEQDYCEYDVEKIKHNELNDIEELFGYSITKSDSNDDIDHAQRAKSGKVHFSYAVADEAYLRNREELKLPFPGPPYDEELKFYFKSRREDKADKNQGPRLAGRKFYYRTEKAKKGGDPCRTLKDAIFADKSYPSFSFRVHFENLSSLELRLLFFGLNLGQNQQPGKLNPVEKNDILYIDDEIPLLCHQIGHGKNFGMGAVKICIEENDLLDGKMRPFAVRTRFNKDTYKIEGYYRYPDLNFLKAGEFPEELKRLSYYHVKARSYPPKNKARR